MIIMSRNKPSEAEWDKVADLWHRETGEKGLWHQKHDIDPVIFNILGKVKGKKILDLGCGNGYFARLLAKRGARLIAVDISSKLIDLAKAEEKRKPLGIIYFLGDAANLEKIKSNSFDIVVANMSLMDIKNAEGAVKEVSRVLKRGGRFIFSIVHPAFHDARQYWIICKCGDKKYYSRVVFKYLSSSSEKSIFPLGIFRKEFKRTQYHRPVTAYFNYLKNAGFLVSDFQEIATKKQVTRAKRGEKDIEQRRSKYFKISEKKIKEFAGKEIPLFLIVAALKLK